MEVSKVNLRGQKVREVTKLYDGGRDGMINDLIPGHFGRGRRRERGPRDTDRPGGLEGGDGET